MPLVVSGAGVAMPGRRVNALVMAEDLFATISHLTSAGAPAQEGRSFLHVLQNSKAQVPRRERLFVAIHQPHFSNYGVRPGGAYIEARAGYHRGKKLWKLIVHYLEEMCGRVDRAYELYELTSDPAEETNLVHVKPHAKLVAQLANRFQDWRKKNNAAMPMWRHSRHCTCGATVDMVGPTASLEPNVAPPTAAGACAQCNWQCYLDRYPHLQLVYGPQNVAGAERHYTEHGRRQGRDCSCTLTTRAVGADVATAGRDCSCTPTTRAVGADVATALATTPHPV